MEDMENNENVERGTHTDDIRIERKECKSDRQNQLRDISTLLELLSHSDDKRDELTTSEVKYLVDEGYIALHKLEAILGDNQKAVEVRRMCIDDQSSRPGVLAGLPYSNFDYSLVTGACCENVIGYVPVPLGVAGPLLINGKNYFVPMATTEGCLVASTNRGCRALNLGGGVNSTVYSDGMTRGPVIHFPSAMRAVEALKWLRVEENYAKVKEEFDSTSRFARLQTIDSRIAGRYLFLRFVGSTGDAMGMNMVSKGTEAALRVINKEFRDIEAMCISGNSCADKKSAAINWIKGRGKSVVCEALIPGKVVMDVLKTTAKALEKFNISKNLIGSAIAGTCGGNNTHAANIVAAIFIACGQDPAQTVTSANCITLMKAKGNDLHISCSMPSVEIGTVGGGTVLKAQSACLQLLGVNGSSAQTPGSNSRKLASIICAAVMAGELSGLSALASGQLVQSHMRLNRSSLNVSALDQTHPKSMNCLNLNL